MGKLTVDSKQENFVLQVPFHLNALAQRAPNRRFVKSKKAWFLPGLRLNAEYLKNTVVSNSNIQADNQAIDLIDRVLEKTACREVPFPSWYRFKEGYEPMQKQMEALNKAWGKKYFCFAMDRGTGKTKMYIEIGTALFIDGAIDAVVVLTKNSVVNKILREVDKHCPLPEGQKSTLAPAFDTKAKVRHAEEFISAEGTKLKFLSMGVESFSVGKKEGKAFDYLWSFVVKNRVAIFVDESHMIKTPNSIRTENITDIGTLCDYRFIGTGTLTPQGLLDLYAQYQFLDPNIIGIGNYYCFKNRYAVMGGFENKEVVGYDNVEELMELIRPWTFQVSKEEMVDLPPKIYTEPIVVGMTKEQARVYNDIKQTRMTELQSMKNESTEVMVESVLQMYGLLRQIASGFISYDDEDGKRIRQWIVEPEKNVKYRELLSLLDSDPHQQFTIWTCYLMELHAVHELLNKNGHETVKLHGAMSRQERDEALAAFESGRAKHLVATQETGGVGLDFVHSTNVVYLSNMFKYVYRAQSEDRNHRKGTTNKVVYTDIIVKGTPDEDVIEALRQKQDLADYVLRRLKDDKHPLTDL